MSLEVLSTATAPAPLRSPRERRADPGRREWKWERLRVWVVKSTVDGQSR